MRLFLAVPGTACPAARRPRSTEPAAPGYGGNARWTRRIGPDSCAWPWTNPGRNPALPKEIRTGAISSQASDQRQRGSTVASNSGDNAPGVKRSVPVRGEYPSRRSPCGRLGWPVTPGTGRIPPKGPKRVQHYRRQSVVSTGRKLLSGYGRCQEGYHLDCLASTHRTSDTGQRFTCQPFYLLRTAGPPARAAGARRRPARAGAHEAASPP